MEFLNMIRWSNFWHITVMLLLISTLGIWKSLFFPFVENLFSSSSHSISSFHALSLSRAFPPTLWRYFYTSSSRRQDGAPSSAMNQTIFQMQIYPIVKWSCDGAWQSLFSFWVNRALTSYVRCDRMEKFRNVLNQPYIHTIDLSIRHDDWTVLMIWQ